MVTQCRVVNTGPKGSNLQRVSFRVLPLPLEALLRMLARAGSISKTFLGTRLVEVDLTLKEIGLACAVSTLKIFLGICLVDVGIFFKKLGLARGMSSLRIATVICLVAVVINVNKVGLAL